jgi:hypothetical protein
VLFHLVVVVTGPASDSFPTEAEIEDEDGTASHDV